MKCAGLAILLAIPACLATAQTGQPRATDTTQREIIEQRREIDVLQEKIRLFMVNKDYRGVLRACDELEKVDPKNGRLILYRSTAEREIARQRALGETAATTPTTALTPFVPTATPVSAFDSTPLPLPPNAEPGQSPSLLEMTSVKETPMAGHPERISSAPAISPRKKPKIDPMLMYSILGGVALIAATFIVILIVRRKRNARVAAPTVAPTIPTAIAKPSPRMSAPSVPIMPPPPVTPAPEQEIPVISPDFFEEPRQASVPAPAPPAPPPPPTPEASPPAAPPQRVESRAEITSLDLMGFGAAEEKKSAAAPAPEAASASAPSFEDLGISFDVPSQPPKTPAAMPDFPSLDILAEPPPSPKKESPLDLAFLGLPETGTAKPAQDDLTSQRSKVSLDSELFAPQSAPSPPPAPPAPSDAELTAGVGTEGGMDLTKSFEQALFASATDDDTQAAPAGGSDDTKAGDTQAAMTLRSSMPATPPKRSKKDETLSISPSNLVSRNEPFTPPGKSLDAEQTQVLHPSERRGDPSATRPTQSAEGIPGDAFFDSLASGASPTAPGSKSGKDISDMDTSLDFLQAGAEPDVNIVQNVGGMSADQQFWKDKPPGAPDSEKTRPSWAPEPQALNPASTSSESLDLSQFTNLEPLPVEGAGPSQNLLDSRNERLFQEELKKGMEAFDKQDWGHAVHYFSIAAALKPKDAQVREKLHQARSQRDK